MQDPLPEEIQPGAPKPQTFDKLHPADLPFASPRTPRQGESCLDRLIVVPKPLGHGLKRWQSRGFCVGDPLIECCDVPLGQERLKALLELVAMREQGIGFQLLALQLGQPPGRLKDHTRQ